MPYINPPVQHRKSVVPMLPNRLVNLFLLRSFSINWIKWIFLNIFLQITLLLVFKLLKKHETLQKVMLYVKKKKKTWQVCLLKVSLSSCWWLRSTNRTSCLLLVLTSFYLLVWPIIFIKYIYKNNWNWSHINH